MLLSKKTLEILRSIINGDGTDHYRSGPKLVSFFNQLGFNDAYGQGFPSRWAYTDDRLQRINGTPELDKCIKMTFAVIDFVGEIDTLDQLIAQFNQYMAFDKWQVMLLKELFHPLTFVFLLPWQMLPSEVYLHTMMSSLSQWKRNR